MTPVVRRRAVVAGRVQGVWYRDSARREAERLGLAGRARNQPDGTVLLEAEGPADAVAALLAWARLGPPRAVVTDLRVQEVAATGQEGFAVD